MIIDGYCKACDKYFDAHWHNLPKDSKPGDRVPCPQCGTSKVKYTTDEDHDYKYDVEERSPQEDE